MKGKRDVWLWSKSSCTQMTAADRELESLLRIASNILQETRATSPIAKGAVKDIPLQKKT